MPKPQPDRTAFPSSEETTDGLSKREWFAGQALTGYLAAFAGDDTSLPDARAAGRIAVEYADATLAALYPPTKQADDE